MSCRIYPKSGHHFNRLNDHQLYCRCGQVNTVLLWNHTNWPNWQPTYFTYTSNSTAPTSTGSTWQAVNPNATYTTWTDVQKAVEGGQEDN